MVKCPFCNNEMEPDIDKCICCKNESSNYTYFRMKADELIKRAKDYTNEKSITIGLLKRSFVLNSTNALPLKLLGLHYSSVGEYNSALNYLDEYNKRADSDQKTKEISDQLFQWKKIMDRFLSVTF